MTQQTDLAGMSENVRECQGAKSRLSEKQLMAIELLLRGHSIDDTAWATGVTPRTIHRGSSGRQTQSRASRSWKGDQGEMNGFKDSATEVAPPAVALECHCLLCNFPFACGSIRSA